MEPYVDVLVLLCIVLEDMFESTVFLSLELYHCASREDPSGTVEADRQSTDRA